MTIIADASLVGMGGTLPTLFNQGELGDTSQEGAEHINVLELVAIRYMTLSFRDLVSGKTVDILMDRTALSYVS